MPAKAKYMPRPRGFTHEQVAARLGVSLAWLSANKTAMRNAGLPQPDPLTGRTDRKALEYWMDRRSGLVDQLPTLGTSYDRSLAAVTGLNHGNIDA